MTFSLAMTKEDLVWLHAYETLLKDHISDASFTVTTMATTLNMSKRQLFRKSKQLTGLSPVQYLLQLRLAYAERLILSRNHNSIKSVAHASGFNHMSYFARQYKAYFGRLPSEEG